jgi:hypothetical protein
MSNKELRRHEKVSLGVRIWAWYVLLVVLVRRRPLPELIERIGRVSRAPRRRYGPEHLSRAVERALRLARPTCLVSSLVLYRLLHEQGEPAELVIGPPLSRPHRVAHAWVEIEGRDVGPPPGRAGREVLARFA